MKLLISISLCFASIHAFAYSAPVPSNEPTYYCQPMKNAMDAELERVFDQDLKRSIFEILKSKYQEVGISLKQSDIIFYFTYIPTNLAYDPKTGWDPYGTLQGVVMSLQVWFPQRKDYFDIEIDSEHQCSRELMKRSSEAVLQSQNNCLTYAYSSADLLELDAVGRPTAMRCERVAGAWEHETITPVNFTVVNRDSGYRLENAVFELSKVIRYAP